MSGARETGFDASQLIEGLVSAPAVTVAIAVYDGADHVARCIRSVLRHTPNAKILVIDDASPDPVTRRLLDDHAASGEIRLVRNETNLGYTRTANRAIALSAPDDVVLLNSDTEVGPQWLERLRWTAYSRRGVATVSAISDNAGAMAMPEPGVPNVWNERLGIDEIAMHVARHTPGWAVETPTCHGFCVYLRREALDMLGGFDEARFPRGYGEENDFSRRAVGAGFVNLLAPHVFVRHAQGVSFGDERAELIASARAVIDELHPDYTSAVRAWASGDEMIQTRADARSIRDELSEQIRVPPRILYSLHASGGGTPATNRDLMTALRTSQESYLLLTSPTTVELYRWTRGMGKLLETWSPASEFTIRDTWRPDYAAFLAGVIARHGIQLVHVRHVINQPLTTIGEVARLLGIPMVLSTHDFYLVCPSVHLLDQNHSFCGGVCTPGPGQCVAPTTFVSGITNLKHGWVYEWRDRGLRLLDVSAAIIATTPSALAVMTRSFPEHADRMQVIEHGRDLSEGWVPLRESRPRRPGPLRIACPANWDAHKGSDYLAALIEATGDGVEWHLFGPRSDQVHPRAIAHGRYRRDALPDLYDAIDPDFVGVFSIWGETYSHTLTEAWALGVPVLATDIGAVGDRIREHGGGRVYPVDQPAAAAPDLQRMAADILAGREVEHEVPRHSIRSVLTMAEDYSELYDRIMRRTSRPNIGIVVHSDNGRHPGSAHVRVLRRLENDRDASWRYRVVDPRDLASGADRAEYAAILVQRNSVPAGVAPALRATLSARGIPLVIEADDDLVSDDAVTSLPEVGYDTQSLVQFRRMAEVADRIIASTQTLADVYRPITPRVAPIANELDLRIWESITTPESPPADGIRLLYMGTRTHTGDLELLRPVVEELRSSGLDVVLEVVGVTDDDGEWYERIWVPSKRSEYPMFARWLLNLAPRWSAGLAPLVDTPFNRAKSDLKFLEYSALGLPTIASRVTPYLEIEAHGGVLADNSTAAWVDAVRSVLQDPETAAARAERARAYALGDRSIQYGSGQAMWRTIMGDLASADRVVDATTR